MKGTASAPPDRARAIRFIVALGFVSLLNDVTYEGARSIAGPFLGALGASAFAVAMIAGLGELAGYALRLFSGYLADRTRSYWAITIAGYIVNLTAVPALALTSAWLPAGGLIVAERSGKALRTPARDVMLSQASKSVGRGWGFGLHEAMDQTGALAGPLIVAGVLAATHEYWRAFAWLAVPAALAIGALLFARFEFPNPEIFESTEQSLDTTGLSREFWMYVVAAGLVAAGSIDFALISFHFGRAGLMSAAFIPVVYAVAQAAAGISGFYFGRWFDRVGVWAIVTGIVFDIAAPALVLLGGFGAAVAGMILWGAGLGATQPLFRAAIGDMVSAARRGSAYGIFNTVYGLLWFAGSAVVGALYGVSLTGAVLFSIAAQLAGLLLFARTGVRMRRA